MATEEFSKRLRKLMVARGMNQVDLAKASGLTQPQISAYLSQSKRGKYPSFESLKSLARALRCDLYELTGLEELRGRQDVPPPPDAEAQALWEIYMSLPEGDTLKELLKQKIQERKAKNESGE